MHYHLLPRRPLGWAGLLRSVPAQQVFFQPPRKSEDQQDHHQEELAQTSARRCRRSVQTTRVAEPGAYGVILKDMASEILVQSLRQVADGQRLLPLPLKDQTVPREQRNVANTENVLTVLTDRERQIMRLVSEGLSSKEIGRRLNIVYGTIKRHLHNIFQNLAISNSTVL